MYGNQSRTQDNRTNGKVTILLKFRHLSALFPWNNFRFELHVSYSSLSNEVVCPHKTVTVSYQVIWDGFPVMSNFTENSEPGLLVKGLEEVWIGFLNSERFPFVRTDRLGRTGSHCFKWKTERPVQVITCVGLTCCTCKGHCKQHGGFISQPPTLFVDLLFSEEE